MIDLYCERVAPGLLGEPLNAATNACFILAAWASWRRGRERADVRLLAALMAAIGLGSAAFHTLASAWAQWLDVAPIGFFQLVYLWLYLRRCGGVAQVPALALLAAYCAALALAAQWPLRMNGSLAYAPAAAVLIGLGLWHWWARRAARGIVLTAGLVFVAALTARTVDNALCAEWPAGTHWLWHALNAVVLFLLVEGLRRNLPTAAAARAHG